MEIPIEIIVAIFGAFTIGLNSIIAAAFWVVFNYIASVKTEARESLEKEVKKSEEADHRINKALENSSQALEKAKDKATENDKQLFIKTENMRVDDAWNRGIIEGIKQAKEKSK